MDPQLKQWAYPWRYGYEKSSRIRDVRLHDISPASAIARSELLPGRQASKILRISTSTGYNPVSSVIKEAHSRSLSTRKRVPSPENHRTEEGVFLQGKFCRLGGIL